MSTWRVYAIKDHHGLYYLVGRAWNDGKFEEVKEECFADRGTAVALAEELNRAEAGPAPELDFSRLDRLANSNNAGPALSPKAKAKKTEAAAPAPKVKKAEASTFAPTEERAVIERARQKRRGGNGA